MPGQPTKMAERVTELEAQAFCVAADIFLTVPRKYLDEPDRPSDPVWQGWRACIDLSLALHIKVLEQANRLREKAALQPIPDPSADMPPGGEPPADTPIESLPAETIRAELPEMAPKKMETADANA